MNFIKTKDMSKIILYSAVSFNFKIADSNGGVGWLDDINHPQGCDYGYAKFYSSISHTLMGYKTYAQLKSWDVEFPYKNKRNYVFTRKENLDNDEYVEFVQENHMEFLARLKQEAVKDIWLIGGGGLNSSLLKAHLIDEMIIHVMPVILDGGIDLFSDGTAFKHLQLIDEEKYENGVVELRYQIKN